MNDRQARSVVIDYTNWRGERSERRIRPYSIVYSSTEWHPEPQWILLAWDVERMVDRGFAMKDIHAWKPATDAGHQRSYTEFSDEMD